LLVFELWDFRGFFAAVGVTMCIGGLNMSAKVNINSLSSSNWAFLGSFNPTMQVCLHQFLV
jgi:hypothetical protein